MKKTISTSLAAVLLTATTCAIAARCQPKAAYNGEAEVNAAPTQSAARQSTQDQKILHLLNRATFGPTPEDIALVHNIGIDEYIREQLDPRSIPQKPELNQLVADTTVLSDSPVNLIMTYSRQTMAAKAQSAGIADKEDLQKQINQTYQGLRQQMLVAKLRRNIESPRQLEEVMTEFWFNHFNVTDKKGAMDRFLVGSFEQQAIRPYALGKFRDLLEATAHHPAMLFYLDNWQNTAPDSPGSKGKLKGINENYARELMELHTLGVDGGYSQQDVVALAHVLTGLGLPPVRQIQAGRAQANSFGSFFDRNRHDFGDKQLLGRTIRGTGEEEIEQALDVLAMHPSTARHISYQLAQYFVCDNPPESLVNRLSKTYLSSAGDIKSVMNELLHSPEFWDSSNVAVKYKSPYRYAISVVRASGAQVTDYKRLAGFVAQLGQPIYGCLTPDGYKNTQDAWLNPDGLLKRITFATNVTRGTLGQVPEDELNRVQFSVGPLLGSKTVTALASSRDAQRAGLMLGSPEFMTY